MHTFHGMTWPNWVDMVILTLILRMAYNGSVHGFWREILNVTGAVSITALTVNYAGVVTGWLQPHWWWAPQLTDLVGFWGLFLMLVLGGHLIIDRAATLIKEERLHWALQGMGLFLGGLRGLWWSGFLLIVLASSGLNGLRQSVEERSLIGPQLLPVARASLEQVAERFPGAQPRGSDLVPSIGSDATHS